MVKESPWPISGYAPGGYHCKCIACEEVFEGDKRATRCLECAVIEAKLRLANSEAFLKLTIEILVLFREFVIKNATQWMLGSNHHHPMWMMISTLFETYKEKYKTKLVTDIWTGPRWQFIQARNKLPLETLLEANPKGKSDA